MSEPRRPSPEELLERYNLKSPEEPGRRGRLRVFLGAAPGVGKTFAMLNEGRRLKAEGHDVVAGFIESHGRGREVGKFLTEEERRHLAAELQRLIGDMNQSPELPGAGSP